MTQIRNSCTSEPPFRIWVIGISNLKSFPFLIFYFILGHIFEFGFFDLVDSLFDVTLVLLARLLVRTAGIIKIGSGFSLTG